MAIDEDAWNTAVAAVGRARRVVVFTGAGMSAESGIPTFRDADGFWQRFPPERFATWSGLLQMVVKQPRSVAEFAWNVVQPIAVATANAGHRAVADLEARVPVTVITQNIDGLHQSAGSSEVHEIHGSLFEIVDHSTGRIVHRLDREELRQIATELRNMWTASRRSLRSPSDCASSTHSIGTVGRIWSYSATHSPSQLGPKHGHGGRLRRSVVGGHLGCRLSSSHAAGSGQSRGRDGHHDRSSAFDRLLAGGNREPVLPALMRDAFPTN